MSKLSPSGKKYNQITPPHTPAPQTRPLPASETADWRNELTIQSQTERIHHLERQLASERQTRLGLESQIRDQRNVENLRREVGRAWKEAESARRAVESMRTEVRDSKERANVAEVKLHDSEMDRIKLEFQLHGERMKVQTLQKKAQAPSTQVGALENAVYTRYRNQWRLFGRLRALESLEDGEVVGVGEVLRFEDVPWPVFTLPVTPEGITKAEVRRFMDVSAAAGEGEGKSIRKRVKDWLLVWHPDKFEGQ